MINEVRTLLLNIAAGQPSDDGEEYIEPAYSPVILSGDLAAVRDALFGSAPDRRGLLLYGRRYLSLLHASPLAAHVPAYFDPRITYLPLPVASFLLPPTLAVTPLGSHGHVATLAGSVGATSRGQCRFAWRLTVIDALTAQIEDLPANQVTTVPPTLVADANTVVLPGSSLRVQYPAAAPPGTAWQIDATTDVAVDVGDAATRVATAGVTTEQTLFGAEPGEPFATWRNLWESREPLPYRLGAALLALAWRTKRLREGSQP